MSGVKGVAGRTTDRVGASSFGGLLAKSLRASATGVPSFVSTRAVSLMGPSPMAAKLPSVRDVRTTSVSVGTAVASSIVGLSRSG